MKPATKKEPSLALVEETLPQDIAQWTDEQVQARAHHHLDIATLAGLCDPFSSWGELTRPITRKEVKACLAAGQEELCTTPLWSEGLSKPASERLSSEQARSAHIRKIAFFAKHAANSPIEIDVGIPSMNCYVEHMVQDGNHRLAGAIIRGDKTIAAKVGGSMGHAQNLGLWAPNAFEQESWARFEKAHAKPARKQAKRTAR